MVNEKQKRHVNACPDVEAAYRQRWAPMPERMVACWLDSADTYTSSQIINPSSPNKATPRL